MPDESDDERVGSLFTGIERAEREQVDSGDRADFTPKERPRGILSQTDREYLFGLKEYAQIQTDANRRQAIRERVHNGLKDFVLLVFGLPEAEREKIFDGLEEENELEEILGFLVAFVYLGLEKDQQRVESVLERGILQAENYDKLFESAGRAMNVDVSLSVDYNPDVDRLVGRLERGDDLTDAEIGALVKAGRLDPENLKQLEEKGTEFPGVSIGDRTDANADSEN